MASRPFLFGNLSSTNSKHLVEFRAGKMVMKSNNMVHPEARKGLVYVHQTDDSLIHFCWKERSSSQVEDDLIIFPDDAEFKRVAQCTSGRVYVLKFKSNPRRCFFWMQEPGDEKDDENCKKINEYFNNPPTPGQRNAAGASGRGENRDLHGLDLGSLGDADLQNLLNNMNPQQLIQMLGGGGGGLASIFSNAGGGSARASGRSGSSGPPTTSTLPTASRVTASSSGSTTTVSDSIPKPTPSVGSVDSSGGAVQLSDLQSIISGLTVPSDVAARQVHVDLSSSLNLEVLRPLLDNKNFMDRVKTHLPPKVGPDGSAQPVTSSDAPEQLASTVTSPQFQSALSIFSSALQSGQLGPLMEQFELPPECVAAANEGNLEQFVKAMEQSTKAEGGSKKEDDSMALD